MVDKDLLPTCADLKDGEEDAHFPMPQELLVGELVFSYDVVFIKSSKTIGSRWDAYMFMGSEDT